MQHFLKNFLWTKHNLQFHCCANCQICHHPFFFLVARSLFLSMDPSIALLVIPVTMKGLYRWKTEHKPRHKVMIYPQRVSRFSSGRITHAAKMHHRSIYSPVSQSSTLVTINCYFFSCLGHIYIYLETTCYIVDCEKKMNLWKDEDKQNGTPSIHKRLQFSYFKKSNNLNFD